MPDDEHAIFVQIALKKKGHRGVLWYTADFPAQQEHSFELSDAGISWHAEGASFNIKNDKFDVVWYRRPGKPKISESIHPDDQAQASKEAIMLFQTFWYVIAPNARWVNPANNSRMANSKLLQLKMATEVSLKTPKTLISNNPEKIKNFLLSHQASGVIYKALYPMVWFEKDSIRVNYTKEINLKSLPSDSALSMLPGIFQEKIQKAYELRITYFGGYAVTVKLNSQEHPVGQFDWRCIPSHELIVEEYKLPEGIHQKCQALMRKLGIVFGCFDFIVTPENEYYFLEINEAGQFLWVEALNPNIRMLDIFTEFLINQSPDFHWRERPDSVKLSDFEEKTRNLSQEAKKLHKPVKLYQ